MSNVTTLYWLRSICFKTDSIWPTLYVKIILYLLKLNRVGIKNMVKYLSGYYKVVHPGYKDFSRSYFGIEEEESLINFSYN